MLPSVLWAGISFKALFLSGTSVGIIQMQEPNWCSSSSRVQSYAFHGNSILVFNFEGGEDLIEKGVWAIFLVKSSRSEFRCSYVNNWPCAWIIYAASSASVWMSIWVGFWRHRFIRDLSVDISKSKQRNAPKVTVSLAIELSSGTSEFKMVAKRFEGTKESDPSCMAVLFKMSEKNFL